jgi:hypothetical protein
MWGSPYALDQLWVVDEVANYRLYGILNCYQNVRIIQNTIVYTDMAKDVKCVAPGLRP